ncbi:glycosyltransferase [Maribacter algicola]|uniref:Glycosyltransferase n=1 Tax=Meishania litoralis TaxID=3434685 RepID=A0ACC7LKS3_9FLAO
MKILYLIDSLVSGGRERRLVELIKGFDQYPGVSLKLVVFSDKIHYNEIYDRDIDIIIMKRVPKRNPMVFHRLYKLCKAYRPDLIHSWGTMSAIFAIPTSKLLNIKLINGNITDAPKNMTLLHKELFRAKLTFPFSTVVVGNSLAGLKAYRVPKEKGICIYNGFDFGRVANLKDKKLVKKELGIETKKVIGMVGGFFDRKDYKTFINAALLVLKQRDDVTFVAVGEGPNLEICKDLVPKDHANDFVFTGARTDVESIINIFDIGVLSTNSEVHGEGISNAILEYMAMEKPVVATIGGGTNEIVEPGKTGILIPDSAPENMASELNYLLENVVDAKAMGQKGKQRIEEFFSLAKMIDAYHKLYISLID